MFENQTKPYDYSDLIADHVAELARIVRKDDLLPKVCDFCENKNFGSYAAHSFIEFKELFYCCGVCKAQIEKRNERVKFNGLYTTERDNDARRP